MQVGLHQDIFSRGSNYVLIQLNGAIIIQGSKVALG